MHSECRRRHVNPLSNLYHFADEDEPARTRSRSSSAEFDFQLCCVFYGIKCLKWVKDAQVGCCY